MFLRLKKIFETHKKRKTTYIAIFAIAFLIIIPQISNASFHNVNAGEKAALVEEIRADNPGSSIPEKIGNYVTGLLNIGLGTVTSFIVFGAYVLASMLGYILTFIIGVLEHVISPSTFNDGGVVATGWTAVRDLTNLFFIIALLFIAVATILRIENYSSKRLLFKLILMAVLINFSRAIAGTIIQIAQVFMQFFVNSFDGALQGILIKDILDISSYFTAAAKNNGAAGLGEQLTSTDTSINLINIGAGAIMGLIMIIISIVVITIITVILAFRIVALWILIIVSPLAFLLHAIPGGVTYATRWWDTFMKYVLVGPVITFFIWLAAISGRSQGSVEFNSKTTVADLITQIGTADNLFKYIIGIIFLIAGLQAASAAGVAGGALASRTIGRLQKEGTRSVLASRRLAGVGVERASRPALDRLGNLPTILGGGVFARLGSVVGRREQTRQEGAGEYVGGIRDEATMARIAGGRFNTAARRQARNRMPSYTGAEINPETGNLRAQEGFNQLDDAGIRALSANEVQRLSEINGFNFNADQMRVINRQGIRAKIDAMTGGHNITTSQSGRRRYLRDTSAEDQPLHAEGGVTLGRFGKEGSQSITLKMDFDELNNRLKGSGAEFEPAHGVRVDNASMDSVRKEARGMIGENQERLRNASSREEKLDAFRGFGKTFTDEATDAQIDAQIPKYLAQADRAKSRLDDAQALKKTGLVLEKRGGGGDILRHELRGHVAMDMADQTGDKRRDIYNGMDESEKRSMESYLSERGRLSGDSDENIDEYFADILGGQSIGDERTRKKLEELTKDTRSQVQQDSVRKQQKSEGAGDSAPQEIELSNVDLHSDPTISQTINNTNSIAQERGFLNDPFRYAQIKMAISSLDSYIKKRANEQEINIGKLGDRIARLNSAMPGGENVSPLEVKAELEEQGVDEKDIRDLFDELSKE